jgi:hypothetical protein
MTKKTQKNREKGLCAGKKQRNPTDHEVSAINHFTEKCCLMRVAWHKCNIFFIVINKPKFMPVPPPNNDFFLAYKNSQNVNNFQHHFT